jgi:hypothetical protein
LTGWREELERFLATNPRDVGCDQAMAVMHVYAELLAEGVDAAEEFPGVAAHLAACGPCAEDVEGLVALVQDDDAGTDPRTDPPVDPTSGPD